MCFIVQYYVFVSDFSIDFNLKNSDFGLRSSNADD